MYDRIDIDEKWFYMTKDNENYILVDGELEQSTPRRRVRHKGFITKVMFLCAQARPRWDYARHCTWNGKIGIWQRLYYKGYVPLCPSAAEMGLCSSLHLERQNRHMADRYV